MGIAVFTLVTCGAVIVAACTKRFAIRLVALIVSHASLAMVVLIVGSKEVETSVKADYARIFCDLFAELADTATPADIAVHREQLVLLKQRLGTAIYNEEDFASLILDVESLSAVRPKNSSGLEND